MALYVDTAFIDDITPLARTVPLAGATTNPTLLLAARERGQRLSPREVLEALLDAVSGHVLMQPGASEEEEMYAEALDYIGVAPDRVVPKIPMTPVGMRVARRLSAQGLALAFTAVASLTQVYCAAQVRADFVIPYYNRLERAGVDAAARISQMAALLHSQQLSATRILVASVKTPEEAARALLAGAHDLTAPPAVLLALLSDPFSEEAVQGFSRDWEKMNKL
jgi:TalC/MipB family fructose-6-phosphate aldolase